MSLRAFMLAIEQVTNAAKQLCGSEDVNGAVGRREALATFRLGLAALRMKAANLIEANTKLKSDLKDIWTGLLLPCPKCLSGNLRVTKSHSPSDEPHMTTCYYECDDCAFTELHWINQAGHYQMRSPLASRQEREEHEAQLAATRKTNTL